MSPRCHQQAVHLLVDRIDLLAQFLQRWARAGGAWTCVSSAIGVPRSWGAATAGRLKAVRIGLIEGGAAKAKRKHWRF